MNTDSLSVLGIMAQIALGIAIVASALLLLVPIFMVTSSVTYSAGAAIGIFGAFAVIAFLAMAVAGISCMILIPIWTWRGHANLWAANVSGLKIGAGWAALCYFVPIANLFVPAGAMKQLYNRSLGETQYQQADGVSMVTSWWTFSIAWLLVFMAMVMLTMVPLVMPGAFVTMPALGEAGLIFLAAIMQIGASFYLFRIIKTITRAQKAGVHLAQASTFE